MYLVLLCVLVFTSSGCGQTELEKVDAGVRAGNAIVQALGDDKFSKNFGKIGTIASNIGPFLGAIGPAIRLISAFLPGSPSPELQYMKRKFNEMDQKFDRVFREIDEVKILIEKTSLFAEYGEYEQAILDVYDRLQQFMNGTNYALQEGLKNTFIDAYENNFDNAALRLWRGMTSELYVSNNIPKTAMEYTENHRGQVQRLMKGITNLIIQGVKVQLSYMVAKGRNATYEIDKNDWEVRIKELITHMENIDREVTNRWPEQSRKDLNNNLISLNGKSNKDFADKFYDFLIEKYDWRLWYIVVYNELQSSEEHYVKLCGGYKSLNKHGRNVAMVSINEAADPFPRSHASNLLKSVSTYYYRRELFGARKLVIRSANDIYENHFPAEIKNSCTYASAGVIKYYANIHHRAPNGRFTSVVKGQYILFAFGGEYKLFSTLSYLFPFNVLTALNIVNPF